MATLYRHEKVRVVLEHVLNLCPHHEEFFTKPRGPITNQLILVLPACVVWSVIRIGHDLGPVNDISHP